MSTKASNVFSKIYDTIGAFDDLNLLDQTDALTGNFKIRRRSNKKGIARITALFSFNDDIISGLGFKKVKFRAKVSNSLFGDAQNPRKIKSGNKKFDYFDGGSKLVELSVDRNFLNEFETAKKVKGLFRASLDGNFIAMSRGHSDEFSAGKILTAQFELPFIETT